MNVNDDAEWRALAEEWTQPAREADVRFPSAQEIRRRARLQGLVFAGELLLCGVMLALLLWRFLAGGDPVMILAGAVFTLFALAASLWAWRARAAGAAQDVRHALDTATQQACTWLRWIGTGYAVCAAALAYLGLFFWRMPAGGMIYLLPGGIFVAVTLVLLGFLQLRQRRRLAALRALRCELGDEPGPG